MNKLVCVCLLRNWKPIHNLIMTFTKIGFICVSAERKRATFWRANADNYCSSRGGAIGLYEGLFKSIGGYQSFCCPSAITVSIMKSWWAWLWSGKPWYYRQTSSVKSRESPSQYVWINYIQFSTVALLRTAALSWRGLHLPLTRSVSSW
jgi:hypothetical protein